MRPILWSPIVAALLILSLAATSPAAPSLHSTAYAAEDACPPNPSPPDPADPSIIVDSPVAGQRVISPVLISGQARVFEAVVSITIAQGGKPLVETTTMSAEGQTLSPFSTRVPFALAGDVTEDEGCIRVYEASAKDGSPINVVQVPVTLASGPRPPSPGDAGLAGRASSPKSLSAGAIAGSILLLLGLSVARRRRVRHKQ